MSKTDDSYDKKIDNGLKKKKLEKEYGAKFISESNLSPEIESEWLNNIEQFEQQYSKQETIKVWDYVGKPAFIAIGEIEFAKIPNELERLVKIMFEHSVLLNVLSNVEDKELYRFITEELFEHEMDNIRVKGMTTNFIYEEFHPNAELDIRNACDYFFRMTLSKMKNIGGEGYDLLYIDTNHYVDSMGNSVDKKHVQNSINNFLDSFDYFEIFSNEIESIVINEAQTDAQLTLNLHYTGCFNDSPEFIDFKGNAKFLLKPSEYGGWDIYHISMPGLKIER